MSSTDSSMAAKRQGSTESKKRKKFSAIEPEDGEKSNPKRVKFSSNHPNKVTLESSNKGPKEPLKSSKHEGEKSNPKKVKLSSTHPKKPFKSSKQQPFKLKPQFAKSEAGGEKNVSKTKSELRLEAKELAEARKKKRKPHYTLEQELASLWEKMRRRNIAKEDRSKLVSEAIQKMKGKIPEIASSHVSSRVLQYCSQAERDVVFAELRPHFLTLACNTYAVHLVKKMLDNASKNQLAEFISFLHGHVASLLRHMVGSVVVEHAYQSGNATQKQALLMELYSTELQLFKDLVSMKESRLVDVISKLGLQKASVLRYMSSLFQPILEKGIVDHSIIHKALMEYFSIADKASAADVVQQLSGPLLVRMIHTREGSGIAMLCIKHGSAKERKKIIKGMKGNVGKIAHDQYGSMVLACILSIVDDTKLVTKVVIRELQTMLKELVLDKGESDLNSDSDKKKKTLEVGKDGEENTGTEDVIVESNKSTTPGENTDLIDGGKKDHLVRRQELWVNSGPAEVVSLMRALRVQENYFGSNFGKEIIYEVATGGAGGILLSTLDTNLDALHRAIASLVAEPKLEDSEEEHLLENFHSSRTIRRLVLDCPAFASTLWKKAVKGKSEMWAQGHRIGNEIQQKTSSRVVCAFLESSDSVARELAKKELQPLIDSGMLKLPEKKLSAKKIEVSKCSKTKTAP
ncbi:unnamed protein product [Camellia sinensis]